MTTKTAKDLEKMFGVTAQQLDEWEQELLMNLSGNDPERKAPDAGDRQKPPHNKT